MIRISKIVANPRTMPVDRENALVSSRF